MDSDSQQTPDRQIESHHFVSQCVQSVVFGEGEKSFSVYDRPTKKKKKTSSKISVKMLIKEFLDQILSSWNPKKTTFFLHYYLHNHSTSDIRTFGCIYVI